MFTIKLYKYDGANQKVFAAESFSILRGRNSGSTDGPCSSWSEITAHMKNQNDAVRFDIGDSPYQPSGGVWERAIIENAAGRTTEIIGADQPYKAPVAQA